MAGQGAHYSARPVDECEKPVIVAVVQVETCDEPKESLKEKIHEKHEEVEAKVHELEHKIHEKHEEFKDKVAEKEHELKDKIHEKHEEVKDKEHELEEKIHEKHEEVKDKIAEKHLEKEEEKYLKDHKVDAYLLPTGHCDESVLVVVEPEESLKDKIHDKGHEIKEKIHGHKHA
ncbi:hypothetical protein ACET3Z_017523 [Daucus carota]